MFFDGSIDDVSTRHSIRRLRTQSHIKSSFLPLGDSQIRRLRFLQLMTTRLGFYPQTDKLLFMNTTENDIPLDWPPGNLIQEAAVQRLLRESIYKFRHV